MPKKRGQAVASAITSLGYDGIIEFDKSEPEYDFITAACERFESEPHVALLSILAATQDYQLAGDAQLFWSTLDAIIREREALDSKSDVDEVLATSGLILTPSVIAYNIDYCRDEVNRRLTVLEREGLVERVERSKYRLTSRGEQYLEGHDQPSPETH